MGELAVPTECAEHEYELLGVHNYTQSESRTVKGGSYPAEDIPFLSHEKGLYLPREHRHPYYVAISEEYLTDTLEQIQDPESKRKARVEMLQQLGFDASKGYEVTKHIDTRVFFFSPPRK